MSKVSVAYQLYSARDLVQQDMKAVLQQVKAIGYDGVEFAGFFGLPAEQVKAMLDDVGLKAVSSHVPIQLMQADMFGTIAYHQKIGCPYIAIPYLDEHDRPGSAGFAGIIRFISRFGKLCSKAGIQLLYHNHDFEFVEVSGIFGLDFLYEAVPAECLKTQIDTCWVKYAGVNPAEYVMKYAGRAPVVHLKDYVGVRSGSVPYALVGKQERKDDRATQEFEFRPFGHGSHDAKALVEAGIAAGASWFVIEQDLPYSASPLDDAKMSLDTLNQLGVK